jgi:hypothetical protein
MAWVSWLMVLQLQSYQVSLAFSIFSGVLEQAQVFIEKSVKTVY